MNDKVDDLSAAERRAFRELPSEIEPPSGAEERVLHALRRRKLLVSRGPWWGAPSPAAIALATAAALAALVVGIGVGRGSVQAELPRASYVLLLHAGPEFEPDSDANFSERFSAYNRWIAELRGHGQFITGEQLDGSGRVLMPGGPDPLLENRIAEGRDGDILGMFLITAADYDEAVRVASSMPHLEYGGRVAVRRVEPI